MKLRDLKAGRDRAHQSCVLYCMDVLWEEWQQEGGKERKVKGARERRRTEGIKEECVQKKQLYSKMHLLYKNITLYSKFK